MDIKEFIEGSDAPVDTKTEVIHASDLPPPDPLVKTLERLEEIDDGVVLVQFNDRKPMHLYPKLESRGYRYESFEEEEVVTVIWKEK